MRAGDRHRRRLGAAVVLVVALATPASAADPLPPGGTFFDDDDNTHEASIEAIAAAGITRGCAEPDLFCPEDAVTRGQMAAFLVRALELPRPPTSGFADSAGSTFDGDIAALAAADITRGCAPDRFCPDDAVTRGQMAAFLVRALGLPRSDQDPFGDDDESVFEADIAALAAAGITKGCGPGSYCPDEPVTRAQMASLLTRALGFTPITPPPRPSVEIAFTGDTLIHIQLSERARTNGDRTGADYDFGPMFSAIAPILSDTDLALCHLEVPLTDGPPSGYPVFNAPEELAADLSGAGFDGCSTASNHSFDQGATGVRSTIEALEDAGLGQAGMARTPAEADRVTLYPLDGPTVAHISATWWLNGFRLPSDQPWLVEEPLDVDRLLGLASEARRSGADFVVVSMHCCVEYQLMPTAQQKDVARALLASPDVDLVVGHHAHVVQPVELRNGEYVVYGLGNFVSAQRRRPTTTDGVVVIADVALRNGAWVTRSVDFVPTWVEPGTYRVLPAAETIAAGEAGPWATTLEASWRRTVAAIGAMGAPGVEPRTRP